MNIYNVNDQEEYSCERASASRWQWKTGVTQCDEWA